MVSGTAFAITLATILSTVGATTLTLNDYVKFEDGSADNNPPMCAVPYKCLDLKRVTAWSGITSDEDPKCGSCAKVCGKVGCEYLLVIDQDTLEADHLDISTAAGPGIVGSDTGNWVVKMTFVDVKNCAGIWNGTMFQKTQTPNANFKELQSLAKSKGAKTSANLVKLAVSDAPSATSSASLQAAVATSAPAVGPAQLYELSSIASSICDASCAAPTGASASSTTTTTLTVTITSTITVQPGSSEAASFPTTGTGVPALVSAFSTGAFNTFLSSNGTLQTPAVKSNSTAVFTGAASKPTGALSNIWAYAVVPAVALAVQL